MTVSNAGPFTTDSVTDLTAGTFTQDTANASRIGGTITTTTGGINFKVLSPLELKPLARLIKTWPSPPTPPTRASPSRAL